MPNLSNLIRSLSLRNISDLIKEYYVGFKPTAEDEQAIRRAGSYLGQESLDKLIFAIRANYAGIVLTSARLIQGVEKGSSLIELNITNRSRQVFQPRNIVISGYTPRLLCNRATPLPPLLTLSLNWAQIVSKRSGNETAAWAKMADEKVKVQVAYRRESCINPGTLIITIPVLYDLAPQSVNRILIKVVEQESPEMVGIYLMGWNLEVSIDPSNDVYPENIKISIQ